MTSIRRMFHNSNIDFILGDFMSHPFEPASFDAVVSIAALHHMPEGDALDRMAGLLRPGGTLCVVGLARSRVRYRRHMMWRHSLVWTKSGTWEAAA